MKVHGSPLSSKIFGGVGKPLGGALTGPLTCMAMFFVVFGSRLLLVYGYTLPHPFWDSWHVEGEWLYKPFLTGTLKFGDLFRAASEHRPVVLRLYDLALLSLNGQWDVALQMTVNAALFALFSCILWRMLSEGFDRPSRFLLAAIITAMLALPAGWENTLNGHHAGWFFFYIFSGLGIWLAVTRPPCSRSWFLCLPVLEAAYFSLFAGVIAPAAAAATLVFEMLREHRTNRRALAAVTLLLALVALGILVEPRFEAQKMDRAQSGAAFLISLGYTLAWPDYEIGQRLLALHAPWVMVIISLLLRKLDYIPPSPMIVAFGVWTYLQAAGIAFARGRSGAPPAVRYMDILTIGLIVNFAALILLARQKSSLWRTATAAVALVWVWSVWSGLERRTTYEYAVMLPGKRVSSLVQESNLRAFAATGHYAYLANKSPAEIAYYAGSEKVAALLSDPVLRTIYPASIRPPIAVAWPPSAVFQEGGYAPYTPHIEDAQVLGSYGSDGNAVTGSIESGIISPLRLPYLEFRVAGDLGQPGLALKLLEQSGATITVAPPARSLTSWTTVRVPAPREPFRIIAIDQSDKGWLAFCQPREMGRLSFYSNWLLEHSRSFMAAGKAAFGLLLLHEVWLWIGIQRRRKTCEGKERRIGSLRGKNNLTLSIPPRA